MSFHKKSEFAEERAPPFASKLHLRHYVLQNRSGIHVM